MSPSPISRRLLAALVFGSFSLPALAQGLPADVPANSWTATAVANLTEKWQILGLSPAGTFNGNQQVSRYEMAETLWRVARIVERRQAVDLSATDHSPRTFGDVEAQHEAAIEAVVNKYGLFQGFPGMDQHHHFSGGSTVSRYELAVLMQRVMQQAENKKIAVTGKGPDLTYKDVPNTHWCAPILRDLTQRYGLLIGYPDGRYRGEQGLTRYELAIALNAVLGNLLEKQFLAKAPEPAKPGAVPTPEPTVAPQAPLPGFDMDWHLQVGRHDDRDLSAGAGFDLGWWFDKVGGTRPGFGFTGDYALLLNRAAQPLVHAGNANLEMRWRLTGVDTSAEPYLYLGAGYHGEIWFAPNLPLYHAHGIGLTAAGGYPTNVWDIWLTGRVTQTFYLFPDLNYAERLASTQHFFAGVEKRFDANSGLRLGYSGALYSQFPTGGSATFLPAGNGSFLLGGHWMF